MAAEDDYLFGRAVSSGNLDFAKKYLEKHLPVSCEVRDYPKELVCDINVPDYLEYDADITDVVINPHTLDYSLFDSDESIVHSSIYYSFPLDSFSAAKDVKCTPKGKGTYVCTVEGVAEAPDLCAFFDTAIGDLNSELRLRNLRAISCKTKPLRNSKTADKSEYTMTVEVSSPTVDEKAAERIAKTVAGAAVWHAGAGGDVENEVDEGLAKSIKRDIAKRAGLNDVQVTVATSAVGGYVDWNCDDAYTCDVDYHVPARIYIGAGHPAHVIKAVKTFLTQ